MQWSGPSAVVTALKARKWLLVGGLLLFALPFGYSATSGSKATRFIAAALADPLAVLEGRSPGARQSGALAQSKPKKRIPTGLGKPVERVLANVRSRPIIPAAMTVGGAQTPFITVPGLFDPAPAPQRALASTAESAPIANPGGTGSGLLPIGPGGFVVGGGTPPTGPIGPTGPTAEIPPPAGAVPEPQTWVMMLIGFMMIGHGLRSRPRARVDENELKQNI
jgi:hypothetical protein